LTEARLGYSASYTYDRNGIRLTLTVSGESVKTNSHDAAGRIRPSEQGETITPPGTSSGSFDCAAVFGNRQDPTALRLLGNRSNKPATGKLLTRAPIDDGRYWSVYCDSNLMGYVQIYGFRKVRIYIRPLGGFGGGGHAMIGLEAPLESKELYRFYVKPHPTQGRSDSGGSGRSRGGRGHFNLGGHPNRPPAGEFDITTDQWTRLTATMRKNGFDYWKQAPDTTPCDLRTYISAVWVEEVFGTL
jgi:hypothetical protein